MKDTRQNRMWTLAGVVALALTMGVASNLMHGRQASRAVADEGLRDAVASPMPPATAGLAGRPVPTSWFKTPAEQRVEIDSALFSSRRRRSRSLGVAAQ